MSRRVELLEKSFIEASNLISSLLLELKRIEEYTENEDLKKKILLAINAAEKLQKYLSSLRKVVLGFNLRART